MSAQIPSHLQSAEGDPDTLAAIGGWLFRRRTAIPLPIAAALLLVAPGWLFPPLSTLSPVVGVPVVIGGEWIRLWAVHHIGVISRTRSDRLGPLIDTGPFSVVRNPLYLGNILLWVGFSLTANLAWMTLPIVMVLALEYHAIVRWEERLLRARIGDAYVAYTGRVPRWIPLLKAPARLEGAAPFSWKATFYSERGTLIAIAAGFVLLWIKRQL